MTIYKKIGIPIIVLGIAMFVAGVSLFTYQGPPVSHFVMKLGEFCFVYWWEALIVGGILMVIPKSENN